MTVCTTLTAVSASAFEIVPDASPAAASAAYRPIATTRPSTPNVLFDTDASIGITGKATEPALPGIVGAGEPPVQFGSAEAYAWQSVIGDMALRPYAPRDSGSGDSRHEPGNLPLLGVAAIALLAAQLRRSSRPRVE